MTREEARSYIIRHCNPGYPQGKTEWECAINMAIEALSGESSDDMISRQAAIETLDHMDYMPGEWAVNGLTMCKDAIKALPSAQPERTCVNCGRTLNNGGWYADGGTRCPIEEHYALPKDGYCHLWEKRNVTDDDYPERRTDE